MKLWKNETGRSMVEMLGVLAIIGVLSVAGIAGYTMAMNKYKANEIINTASMMRMLAQSKNAGAGGDIANLAEAGLTGSVPSTVSMSATSAGVVTVTNATTDVCKQVNAAGVTWINCAS